MADQNLFRSPFDQLADDQNKEADALLAGQRATRPVVLPDESRATVPDRQDNIAPPATSAPIRTGAANGTKPDSYLPPPELRPVFESAAEKYNLPVNVLMALAHQESRYNPMAVGTPTQWGTAKGIMQNLDSTSKGLGINPFDPNQAIPAAAKQLRERLDNGASFEDAVMEHFAGPDRKLWGPKTAAYGKEVIDKAYKIGDAMMGAESDDTAPDAGKDIPKDWIPITDAQAAEYQAKQDNRFSPSMSREVYENTLRANNPQASQDFVDTAMAQFDKQKALTAQQKISSVGARFDTLKSPEATFDARLNKKLEGAPNGVVPAKPGILQPLPAQPAAAVDGNLLSDAGKSLKTGADIAAQDTRELVGRIPLVGEPIVHGADAVDRYFHPEVKDSGDLLAKDTQAMTAGLTPEARSANEKKWWDSDKGTFGNAWSDPRSYSSGVLQSLPEQLLTMTPAMRLAKMAYTAKIAAGVGVEIASQAAARTAAIAGALSEGALGGAQSAREVRDQVNQLSPDVLAGSDAYKALLEQGMNKQQAQKALADDVSTRAFVLSGVATGMFGGMGDRTIAKLFTEQVGKATVKSVLGAAGRGAAAEGLMEEFPQSALQQLSQNEAMQQANPKQELGDDVINQALGGAALGGLQGGGMGGIAHGSHASTAPTQVEPIPASAVPTAPSTGGPLATAAASAAVQPQRVVVASSDGQAAPGTVAGYQEGPDGKFTAQINGDDGQVYTLTEEDGLQIVPVAPEPAGPLTAAVEQAAEAHAADPAAPNEQALAEIEATKPKPPPAPPAPPDYGGMELPALRDRLKYIVQQAKQSGMNKVFTDDKRAVEKAINAKTKEVKEASKLAEEPITSGPFEDMGAANKMALRMAEHSGVPQEVYGTEGKYKIKPIEQEAGNAVPPTAETGAVLPTTVQDVKPSAVVAADESRADVPTVAVDASAGKPATVNNIPEWKKNPYTPYKFADPAGAEAFMTKNKVDRDLFRVVQTGSVRYEIKPRDAGPKAAGRDKALAVEANVKKLVDAANEKAAARAAEQVTPSASELDAAAHEAATSQLNDLPQPTDAQKEAGNYQKGHVNIHGLDITVENPRGSERSGKRPDGSTWSHTMSDHYGYIKRTVGADDEQIDVYVGPKPDSEKVFVVDQLHQDTGAYDEHKVMMGYPSQTAAVSAYKSNFDKGWKVGPVTPMSVDNFKAWLKDGNTTEPVSDAVQPTTKGEDDGNDKRTEQQPDGADKEQQQAGQEAKQAEPATEAQAGRVLTPRPKKLTGKAAIADRSRRLSDYFTPGNVVKSYAGHDRVLSYEPSADGGFEVKVQGVERKDGAWVTAEGVAGRERTHSTMPSDRELRAGPVERAPAVEEQPAPEQKQEAATEPETDDGSDIPKAFYKKVNVPIDVLIQSEGTYETHDVPADKALASVREDIVNLRSLLDCMRG